jgi:PAS domain-containing protein
MSQQPIEIILTRQLAESLAVAVFLVDADGNLLFYNEPAEVILGQRFEDTGFMTADVWGSIFALTDTAGVPVAAEDLPLSRTLRTGGPAIGEMILRGVDGVRRHIEVATWAIMDRAGRNHGAVAMFWEVGP